MQRCRDVLADRGMKKIESETGKARRVTPTNLPALCSVTPMPRAPSPYPGDFTPLSLADALFAASCSVFVLRWA